ncbi:MAG: pyrroline-5-carboxylate reductase [Clostridiales bacterium]|jgi:pyrroline-5-carboxylate reductase|nr:pyrroline-5-carboxylate reductase [Clostridiales bacterium]
MKYGFIGAGNIASAITEGVLKSQKIPKEDISAFDANEAVLAGFAKRYGVKAQKDAFGVIDFSDMVILSVKPNILLKALSDLQGAFKKAGCLVVSPAAGVTLNDMDKTADLPVVRVMPNLNAAVREAVTAYCANKNVTDERKKVAADFFALTGASVEIEERLFPAFMAIAGCSPAFTYLYVNALAKGAVKYGIDKKTALDVAARAALGAAKMILESGKHPHALIDEVCSPGGTTIEGVCALDAAGFERAVVSAVDAAVLKDRMMNA